MKKYLLLILCALWITPAAAISCDEACSGCHDDKVFSLHQFQNLDMLATFELVYELAESKSIAGELPAGFIRCLDTLRAGDDHVHYCDFLESIELILETILIMRSRDVAATSGASESVDFEAEVKEFAQDVFEALCGIWDRLKVLEENAGI